MLGALAFAALYVLPVHSFAVVSVDDAYSTAQREAGVPLDRAPHYFTTAPAPNEVGFRTLDGREPPRIHRVWLPTGRYTGFDEAGTPTERRDGVSSAAQALDKAKRLAHERFPDDAPAMEWTVDEDASGYTAAGKLSAPPGAPRGPATSCTARIAKDTGNTTYRERRHPRLEPVSVNVPPEQALEAAREALGCPTARLLNEPYLWNAADGVAWHFMVATGDCADVAVEVDARTGRVTEVVPSAEAGRVPAQPVSHATERAPDGAPPQPLFLTGAAAVVFVLAGTAVAVRRRRRAA